MYVLNIIHTVFFKIVILAVYERWYNFSLTYCWLHWFPASLLSAKRPAKRFPMAVAVSSGMGLSNWQRIDCPSMPGLKEKEQPLAKTSRRHNRSISPQGMPWYVHTVRSASV